MSTCPICAHTLKSQAIVSVCPNCGLGITSMGPSHAQYLSYHRDPDYAANHQLFVNLFQRRVGLIRSYVPSGSILEIGSSVGTLLALFPASDYHVQGIEPSTEACAIANANHIPTLCSTFEQASPPSNSFDVIILNHVLEHLADPQAVITKVSTLLKPSGLLYIDVPNFASLSSRLLGGRWSLLLPSEHVWHFTPRSLRLLLSQHDFRVESVHTSSGLLNFASPIQELVTGLITFKKRFFPEVALFPLDLLLTKLSLGSDLSVLARKL